MSSKSDPKMTTIPQLIKDAKKIKIRVLTKRILSEKFGYNESQASAILSMVVSRFPEKSYSEGKCPRCHSYVDAPIKDFNETYFHCQECPQEFFGEEVESKDCVNIG